MSDDIKELAKWDFATVSESSREVIAQELEARGHGFTADAVRLSTIRYRCHRDDQTLEVTLYPDPNTAKMFTKATLQDITYAMQDSGYSVDVLRTPDGTVFRGETLETTE